MQKAKKKYFFNVPHIHNSGGVANFYNNLAPYIEESSILNYVTFYKDKKPSFLQQIGLYIIFFFKLGFSSARMVVLNPSFNARSIRRDLIYIAIAKILQREVAVIWHGWANDMVDTLESAKVQRKIFVFFYNLPRIHFVLSKDFQKDLKTIGVTSKVVKFRTTVHKEFVAGRRIYEEQNSWDKWLFLSRIEEEKGVIEAIEAFAIAQKSNPQLTLKIAGDGSMLKKVEKTVESKNLPGIEILGYVKGKAKQAVLENADVLVFPTRHGEGLPLTILEAMSFGLGIIVTPKGGIGEAISAKNGVVVKNGSPKEIAKAYRELRGRDRREIFETNTKTIRNLYHPKRVAADLLKNIDQVL